MIRRFLKYYKPHKHLFILDFACAFFMSIMDLVFPMFARIIIDDVLPKRDIKLVLWIGLGLLIVYVLRSILQYIVDYWGHILGVRIEYDMRKEMFNHIQRLSFSYFDNNKTGQIMSRLVNDLNEISELAHHGPEDLFITIITLIGSFIIMFMLNVKLALSVLIVMPFMIAFSILSNKKMRKAFRDLRIKLGEINSQAENSLSGIRVVKAFNNEEHESEKFEIGNKNFRISKENSYGAMAVFFAGITFFSNFISLLVLIYGGILIYNNELTIGELFGFLLYVSMFLQPIRRMTSLIENYQKGMAGFSRFTEIMDEVPRIEDKKNAKTIKKVFGDISFENVTFSYNEKKNILENVNLNIKKGSTVAFIGPSGVGKTTLCSLLPRFYEIDEGSIKIDNMNIKDVTQNSLRDNIGIVQQDVFLFSGSVRDNIIYGKVDASEEEIIQAAKNAEIHEYIMTLDDGYDTYIGERGVKLSGGQKQRISIARVFLKNPPIIILDEATSALDNETERAIQKSLNKLSQNRTTLVIAHRLGTIKNADEIIVLNENGIEEKGSHEELIKKNGVYSKLYLN